LTLARIVATAACLAALMAGSNLPAQALGLEDAIERARHLSTTEAVPASQPAIDDLLGRLDEATPRQRVEIELLNARNLALRGLPEAAIDKLNAILDAGLDDDQRLRALRLAANIGINVGRYESGFQRLQAALELLPQSDDLGERARILGLAAYAHTITGRYERGIEQASEGLEIARRSADILLVCRAGQTLSVAYRYAGQLDLAETAAREALQNCREANDKVLMGTVELELGFIALERAELDAAERWADRALDRLRTAVWADGILTARGLKAELAAARGNSEAAIQRAKQLIEDVSERGLWEREAQMHQVAAQQYAALGEFAQAYRHMLARAQARERFLDEDRTRRLASIEVEFEMKRQEQELELLREQKRVAELEAQSRRQSARMRWLGTGFAAFLFLILVLLLVHVLRDRRHFRRLSEIDGLTRVSNHTRFFDTARIMIEGCQRQGQPLVLALCDIDYFKRVNDEHGHSAGDRALREVAGVLQRHFPGAGQVGRIGGEEFAVCLPDAGASEMLERLESVRSDIADIEYGNAGRPLTMSFGVAELAPHEPMEALRERSDAALYEAKHGGRDSVVVAEAESPD